MPMNQATGYRSAGQALGFADTPSHTVRRAAVIAMIAILGDVQIAAATESMAGRVVDVFDGDTVTVLDPDKRQFRIEIDGIDALERGQSGGYRSKESLAALVLDQPVRIEWHRRDREGVLIGKIWVAPPDSPCRGRSDCPMTMDAGLEQIRRGRAFALRTDASEHAAADRLAYEMAEQDARRNKTGFWRGSTAVPPWAWRERRRQHDVAR